MGNTHYKASWRVKLIVWIARRLGFEEPGVQVLSPYIPFDDKYGKQRITIEQIVYLKKVDRRLVKYKLELASIEAEGCHEEE